MPCSDPPRATSVLSLTVKRFLLAAGPLGRLYAAVVHDSFTSEIRQFISQRSRPANFHPVSFHLDDDEPPRSCADLLPWARQLGLQTMLARPAAELRPWLEWPLPAYLFHHRTIEEVLHAPDINPHHATNLLHATRGLLALCAQHIRLNQERARTWSNTLEPELAPFAQLVLDLLKEALVTKAAAAPVLLTADFGLLTDDTPPAISAEFAGHYREGVVTEVSFVGYERGFLRHHCDCSLDTKPCAHLRVTLEAVLDTVFGPPCRLKTWMIETLSVPTWQRQLDALSQVTSPPTPTKRERLVWRIDLLADRLMAQPVLQKLSKTERWSAGRKVNPESLVRTAQLSAEDRMRVDILLMQPSSSQLGLSGPWAIQFLNGLMDSECTFETAPPYAPLRVQSASAALTWEAAGDAFELGLQIAEHRLSAVAAEYHMLDETHGALQRPGNLLVFELPEATLQMLDASANYPAKLPKEAHGPLLDVLTAISSTVDVQLPTALAGRAVAANSTPFLRLTPDGEGLQAELRVRPIGPKDFAVAAGPSRVLHAQDGERTFAERDFDLETKAARTTAERVGLEPTPSATWHLPTAEAALDLVHAAQALGDDLAVEWPCCERWRTVSPGELRVNVQRTADWFGVGGGVEVDGTLLALSALLTAVRSGQRYMRVGPHKFVKIEANLAATARRVDEVTHERRGQLTASLAALEGLDALEDANLDCDQSWLELRARMRAARNLKPRIPSKLEAELRPYQGEGFRWLARMSAWDAGACLADDMGLGKTVQTLAVLLSRQRHGPAIVIAPTSVGPNWLQEAKRFTPTLRVHHYYGPGRESLLDGLGPGDLLVTSYSTMTIDVEALAQIRFDTLVFDEAQAIKNARTQRARAARRLDARWRLALTGTPVENHLGELWSIFSVISPGLLGPWEHFRERFANPIERDGDQPRLEALARLVRPFMLRRTKAKVAPELPPRTEVIEPVELSPAERGVYEASRQQALSDLLDGGAGDNDKIQILAALTRLRRLACHPQLVLPDFAGESSKMQVLLKHIEDLRQAGQRALIFSQFTSFLDLVRAQLDAEGIKYLHLDGKTPMKRRTEGVQQWADGAADLFLISLKAGGSGLNLTGADYVFHLDPWWNPAVEDQATDRTHRIGQTRPVTVVRLIAQGTIEEAVVSLHAEKRALADGLLSGTEAAGKLNSAQLIDLIRVGESDAFVSETESDEPTGLPAPAQETKPKNKRPRRTPDTEPLNAQGLEELGAALAADLSEAIERDELAENTGQVYLNTFSHLVRFAEDQGGQHTLCEWRDTCLTAHAEGRFDGPVRLNKTLRTAVNRARRVAARSAP